MSKRAYNGLHGLRERAVDRSSNLEVIYLSSHRREHLSTYYTPGVGAVSSYIAEHPDKVRDYTCTANLVGATSDGSAVLGLGSVGPLAGLPVMTSTSMFFKRFADINVMANPVPEIMPDVAKRAVAAIIATGRTDFPNQVNNALASPGVFRGALDDHVRDITEQHTQAAAELVEKLDAQHIMPDVFNKRLVPAIANVIV